MKTCGRFPNGLFRRRGGSRIDLTSIVSRQNDGERKDVAQAPDETIFRHMSKNRTHAVFDGHNTTRLKILDEISQIEAGIGDELYEEIGIEAPILFHTGLKQRGHGCFEKCSDIITFLGGIKFRDTGHTSCLYGMIPLRENLSDQGFNAPEMIMERALITGARRACDIAHGNGPQSLFCEKAFSCPDQSRLRILTHFGLYPSTSNDSH